MANGVFYDKAIFADNLNRLMKNNSERKADIARILNVSKTTVSSYCAGTQMPRMDKLEILAHHFGVKRSALIEEQHADTLSKPIPAAVSPAERIYNSLNRSGKDEFIRYGEELCGMSKYSLETVQDRVEYIKHYIIPAAAGYASPIEGEDYELIVKPDNAPNAADFCITVCGDSMEPYIHDGELIYIRRDSPLNEFDVGVFFVDGDVFCKQWCVDYAGTLHLLSANPARQDANISISRDSGSRCVCFGKVLLSKALPRPIYL